MSRIWPTSGEGGMKSFAWPTGTGICFTVPCRWDLQVGWRVPLRPDVLNWTFHEYAEGGPERRDAGLGDIRWGNMGRLVAAGPSCGRFFELIKEKGISFGQIESVIRELIGYDEEEVAVAAEGRRLLALSDEELRTEVQAEGLDPEQVAEEVRALLLKACDTARSRRN